MYEALSQHRRELSYHAQTCGYPITLTTEAQTALEKIARRPSTAQQIARRATIVLRAAQGASQGAIARELGITKDTSRLWRNRWLELSARELPVEDQLQDAPRSGCPPTFTLAQITQLYDLACAPPEQDGRPISHWTDAELADEMMKQQFVDSISPRPVGRWLAEADLKPHQTRYWLHPPRILSLPLKSPTSARSTSRLPSGLSAAS